MEKLSKNKNSAHEKSLKLKLAEIAQNSLSLIFPSDIYCICCGNLINSGRKYSLCDDCMAKLEWVNAHACEKCGVKLDNENVSRCKNCMEHTQEYDRAFTCMVYESRAREMIAAYKFRAKAYMAQPLAEILVDKFLTSGAAADLVIPVPIHKKKLSERGYNQAGLLAKHFAKELDIPIDEEILVRLKYKAAMNKLGAQERTVNIRGSYALSEDEGIIERLKGKSVLLIDDIYTTGSTANECAKLLKYGGAMEVNVLTLAAGAGSVGGDI